jgi:hypothetical protein
MFFAEIDADIGFQCFIAEILIYAIFCVYFLPRTWQLPTTHKNVKKNDEINKIDFKKLFRHIFVAFLFQHINKVDSHVLLNVQIAYRHCIFKLI